MSEYLRENWRDGEKAAIRVGFGRGLTEAARRDSRVIALSGDLMESVGFGEFQKEFGEPRCIEVGVAEQNLVTVASGLAAMGSIPFVASYAAFSPGRNWEQIRTTICLNDRPVKIVGSHAGLNVGADGATHQMLEDIALMRSLPNMVVLAPGDAVEAEQMAQVMSSDIRPNYARLPREKTPLFVSSDTQFEIGKAYVLREGSDIALFGTGVMTYQLLLAAEKLAEQNISAEVVHVPTIKPLDGQTLLASAKKCGRVLTAEEGQIAGGFGGAIAELLSEQAPMLLRRVGVRDTYGESGTMSELWQKHGLDVESIVQNVQKMLQ